MRFIIIISLLISSYARSQHVPLHSQYMFNGVALNPAFTGSDEALTIAGSFRAQWVGFPGAPITNSLAVHFPLRKLNSGLGFQMYTDDIGVNNSTGAYALYSYRLKMKKSSLSFGVSGGLSIVSAEYGQLDVANVEDELLSSERVGGILPDFSFGVHYSAKKYFLTLSLPMVMTHEYDGVKYIMSNRFKNYNLMLGGGYVFEFDNAMKIKPSVLMKYRANTRMQADFNVKVIFNDALDIGVSYRTEEAVIGMIEIRAGKQLSFMYSFGAPISPILKHTLGSHELGVKYTFLFKTLIENPRFLGW
jgi:type IX secretion system PorP/SprF family membrane protein